MTTQHAYFSHTYCHNEGDLPRRICPTPSPLRAEGTLPKAQDFIESLFGREISTLDITCALSNVYPLVDHYPQVHIPEAISITHYKDFVCDLAFHIEVLPGLFYIWNCYVSTPAAVAKWADHSAKKAHQEAEARQRRILTERQEAKERSQRKQAIAKARNERHAQNRARRAYFRKDVVEEMMAKIWHPRNVGRFADWGIGDDD